MNTLTGKLAHFASQLHYDEVPAEVIRQTKENILDSLGCALGGVNFPEIRGVLDQLKKVDKQQDSPVWGMKESASVLTAALMNGMLSHCVEMDDVHKTSKTHTGAVVVPAAVTWSGYAGGLSGKELILAVLLGYETAFRVGTGINAAAHRLQGWHATGICCPFGSAMAAAVLMKLDEREIVNALGMAGTMSSGLWALTKDGANCKKQYMGRAAQSGILAALSAAGGMTGPAYVIEAEDGGLFKAASSNYDFDAVVSGLGSRWDILKTDRKPYACCRSAQPPIDAIRAIKAKHNVKPEDVDSVLVETYEIAVKQCFNTKRPQNVVEAQLCTPYTVAVGLIEGEAMPQQFTQEKLKDEHIMALAQKVDVVAVPEFTDAYPGSWGCRLTVELKNGQRYAETIPNAKGDSANPLSEKELVEKFTVLAKEAMPMEQSKAVVDMVLNLEKLKDCAELTRILAG